MPLGTSLHSQAETCEADPSITLCSATRGLDIFARREPMHYLAVSRPRMASVL